METTLLVLAFLTGIVAGLRSMTAPAAVSWAAHLGWLHLDGTRLSFFGNIVTVFILTALALGELIGDKLPRTPSRKAPGPFGARIVSGALCGAALCISSGPIYAGLLAGALGAVAGTLGGYEARTRLVRALGVPDYVIAVTEDLITVAVAYLTVSRFA